MFTNNKVIKDLLKKDDTSTMKNNKFDEDSEMAL